MDEKILRDYYEANHDKFVKVIHTAHILVEDEARANELYDEVMAGGDFAALATANSLCPSKEQGGDLGFFPNGLFVPPYEEAAHALTTVGEVSKPVKSQFGYHIIKLLGKKDELAFDECKETIQMIAESEASKKDSKE